MASRIGRILGRQIKEVEKNMKAPDRSASDRERDGKTLAVLTATLERLSKLTAEHERQEPKDVETQATARLALERRLADLEAGKRQKRVPRKPERHRGGGPSR